MDRCSYQHRISETPMAIEYVPQSPIPPKSTAATVHHQKVHLILLQQSTVYHQRLQCTSNTSVDTGDKHPQQWHVRPVTSSTVWETEQAQQILAPEIEMEGLGFESCGETDAEGMSYPTWPCTVDDAMDWLSLPCATFIKNPATPRGLPTNMSGDTKRRFHNETLLKHCKEPTLLLDIWLRWQSGRRVCFTSSSRADIQSGMQARSS